VPPAIEFRPPQAHPRPHEKITDEGEAEIDPLELVAGEKIRIRPGDSIPADAIVTRGDALIDQSSITGETVPVDVL
jgi:P-type E1-E2 ATPase